ncbi:DinB family protein [Kitasatospora viridis]|uniref:Uncharacterized protein DUF664 n=1 Tax=Kitasatospora viridis TaxID=281105 RepID=A0A561UB95_9ACTN|nr:DinB family protein [Kitasatospora viridis]TWF96643.1 uncharacterized protein DUF664 [Kitasatospora viridis]
MPDFVPPVADERSALLGYLGKQRDGLLAAVGGLTEEQAWSVPSASELSLAGLLKHGAVTERRWVQAGLLGRALPELWPIVDPAGEFRREDGDTVARLLTAYREVGAETERTVAELASMDVPCLLPEAAQWSARWVLLHLIEETARHAGHADVIRQSIDGAHAADL